MNATKTIIVEGADSQAVAQPGPGQPSEKDVTQFHQSMMQRGSGRHHHHHTEAGSHRSAEHHHTHRQHEHHHGHTHEQGRHEHEHHHGHGHHTHQGRGHAVCRMMHLKPVHHDGQFWPMAALVSGHAVALVGQEAVSLMRSIHHHQTVDPSGSSGAEMVFPFVLLCGMPVMMPFLCTSQGMVSVDTLMKSGTTTVPSDSCLFTVDDYGDLYGSSIPFGGLQILCKNVLTEHGLMAAGDDHSPYQLWMQQGVPAVETCSSDDMQQLSETVAVRVTQACEYIAQGQSTAQIQLYVEGLGHIHVQVMGQSAGTLAIIMSVSTPAVAAVLSAAMPMLLTRLATDKAIKDRFKKIECDVEMSRAD